MEPPLKLHHSTITSAASLGFAWREQIYIRERGEEREGSLGKKRTHPTDKKPAMEKVATSAGFLEARQGGGRRLWRNAGRGKRKEMPGRRRGGRCGARATVGPQGGRTGHCRPTAVGVCVSACVHGGTGHQRAVAREEWFQCLTVEE
jgi:hypothetical protein